jgi:GTP cyclohydrolase II
MSLYPFLAARLKLTLANPPLDVKPVALAVAGAFNVRSGNQQLAARTKNVAKQGPCYTSRFPMKAKSHQGKKSNRKVAGVQMIAHAALPTRYGRFTIYGFKGHGPQEEAVALVRGNLNAKNAPLVRVHSQCLTGDVLASLRCDCRAQLELSLRKIGLASSGILLYLPQEGRGIGLMNKLRAYELQDGGMDTVEANETLGFAADARDYEFSAQILKTLSATKIRLLSNNPEKVRQLESAGIRVVERVPCQPRISKISRAYLKTKKRKMGHLLEGV